MSRTTPGNTVSPQQPDPNARVIKDDIEDLTFAVKRDVAVIYAAFLGISAMEKGEGDPPMPEADVISWCIAGLSERVEAVDATLNKIVTLSQQDGAR